MVGTDHMPLAHELSERVPDGATVGTLADYLADASTDGLSHWRGELRSGARANLLPGVVSARIDLKAACGRAERWLERYAEPLQALYGGDWPEPFLAQAWTRMFQNSAHDSICGCSADEVSAQVLVRYAEAEQIGRELAERAVARIAADVPRDAFVVVNPTPRERSDLVELELVVPEDWTAVELELPDGSRVPTQEIDRQEPLLWETNLVGADVPLVIARRLHGRELFGRIVNGFRIEQGLATLEVGDEADPEWLDVEQLVREVTFATAEGQWTLRVVARPKRTVVAAVTAPPLGWTSVRPVRVSRSKPRTWFPVDVSQLTRIVRGRDGGDSYNYAPPPGDVVDTPIDQGVELHHLRGGLARPQGIREEPGVGRNATRANLARHQRARRSRQHTAAAPRHLPRARRPRSEPRRGRRPDPPRRRRTLAASPPRPGDPRRRGQRRRGLGDLGYGPLNFAAFACVTSAVPVSTFFLTFHDGHFQSPPSATSSAHALPPGYSYSSSDSGSISTL